MTQHQCVVLMECNETRRWNETVGEKELGQPLWYAIRSSVGGTRRQCTEHGWVRVVVEEEEELGGSCNKVTHT
ncbi:hypothetical protein NECAME_03994 [Necator americanus]|uniref:Uncharacterized protein n=1 Tax=Necator americanus TaxID=51031 RepID=W2SY89_NECAM|nr:hypothetical protein NECAME_03994 [Necator americanus]ETN74508.1 hypothetical protein NECAME_03994 [Necator americanus]